MTTKTQEITKESIIEAWAEFFPNSSMSITNPCLGKGLSCAGRLAKDKTECSHGIAQNDPLTYHFYIDDKTGDYKEYRCYIHVRPTRPHYCYDSVRIRKKNIKGVTLDKLKKRFEQVKTLVVDNRENFINLEFNINDKI